MDNQQLDLELLPCDLPHFILVYTTMYMLDMTITL